MIAIVEFFFVLLTIEKSLRKKLEQSEEVKDFAKCKQLKGF